MLESVCGRGCSPSGRPWATCRLFVASLAHVCVKRRRRACDFRGKVKPAEKPPSREHDARPPAEQRSYANAREILPAEVLRIVQAHFDGGLLWVPPREYRRQKTKGQEERNHQILREKADGASTRALASKYGLSDARIRQLIRAAKHSS
jgi:hypothetical protein